MLSTTVTRWTVAERLQESHNATGIMRRFCFLLCFIFFVGENLLTMKQRTAIKKLSNKNSMKKKNNAHNLDTGSEVVTQCGSKWNRPKAHTHKKDGSEKSAASKTTSFHGPQGPANRHATAARRRRKEQGKARTVQYSSSSSRGKSVNFLITKYFLLKHAQASLRFFKRAGRGVSVGVTCRLGGGFFAQTFPCQVWRSWHGLRKRKNAHAYSREMRAALRELSAFLSLFFFFLFFFFFFLSLSPFFGPTQSTTVGSWTIKLWLTQKFIHWILVTSPEKKIAWWRSLTLAHSFFLPSSDSSFAPHPLAPKSVHRELCIFKFI